MLLINVFCWRIDLEAAHKDLRKRGVVLAMKKSSRIATEGLLAVAHSDNKASVIELNCETDFVARNEIFRHLVSNMLHQSIILYELYCAN